MGHKVGNLAKWHDRMTDLSSIVVLFSLLMIFAFHHEFEKSDSILGEIVAEEPQFDEPPVIAPPPKQKVTATPSTTLVPVPMEDENMDDVEEEVFDPNTLLAPKIADNSMPPPPILTEASEGEIFDFIALAEKPKETAKGTKQMRRYMLKNYPKIPKDMGTSGMVVLRFIIDTKGNVGNVEVLHEKPKNQGFGEVATAAIKLLTYTPGMQRDKPVKVRATKNLIFKIKK